MNDRVNAEKHVRKALETALTGVIADLRAEVPAEALAWGGGNVYGTSEDPKFPIWWPNQTFYSSPVGGGDAKPPFFIRVSHHPSPPRPSTVGRNPRVLLRGHSIIGCHIPEAAGEDLIDNLANAVMFAYPYDGVFTREGFEVHMQNIDPKPAHPALGRYYKPIHINWFCWRST